MNNGSEDGSPRDIAADANIAVVIAGAQPIGDEGVTVVRLTSPTHQEHIAMGQPGPALGGRTHLLVGKGAGHPEGQREDRVFPTSAGEEVLVVAMPPAGGILANIRVDVGAAERAPTQPEHAL